MEDFKKDYIEFDLSEELYFDTWLSVKYTNSKGGVSWCQYQIPILRKDGTKRLFGDLYYYFTRKEGFRMAIGYFIKTDLYGISQRGGQYFYFDKKRTPYFRNPLLKGSQL